MHSVVRGFVSARMSIAIVRATHLCLRGSRVPLSQIGRRPQWEDIQGWFSVCSKQTIRTSVLQNYQSLQYVRYP
jgi:hypothetical protein